MEKEGGRREDGGRPRERSWATEEDSYGEVGVEISTGWLRGRTRREEGERGGLYDYRRARCIQFG